MPRIAQIDVNPGSIQIGTAKTEEAALRIERTGASIGNDYRRGFQELGAGIEQAGEQYGLQHEAPKLASERADTETKIQLGTDQFFKSADPDDPDLATKYRDWLDGQLEGFGQDTISGVGARVSSQMREEMRNHFTGVGLADSANVAARGAVTAMDKSQNNREQMAMSDPTQYEYAQKAYKQDFDLQVAAHNLTPEQISVMQAHFLEGQKGIAVAAMRASAERNPEQLEKDIANGRYVGVVGEREITEARNYGMTQMRAGLELVKQQAAEQRKAEDDQFKGALTNAYTAMQQPDGTLRPVDPTALARMTQLPGGQRDPSAIRSFMDLNATLTKEQLEGKVIASDPHAFADASSRASLPPSDPHALTLPELNNMRVAGHLSDHDYSMLRSSVEDMDKDPGRRDAYSQFEKQMTAVKGIMTHANILSGRADAAGDQRYAEFLRSERQAFDKSYQDGSWRKWLNDNNAVKDAVRFAPDTATSQRMANKPTYLPPPATGHAQPKIQPGESAEAYLKRIGQ